MQKILLPFIILLALYIGYDALTSDAEPTESTKTTEVVAATEEPVKDIFVKYVKEPVIADIDDNPLLGKYSASVENDKLTAAIKVEILSDKRIKHYRYVDRHGAVTEGTVEGQYIIDGDKLEFTFPESRDKAVFPMGMLILKVAKDNSISSGAVQFTKL